MSNNHLDCDKEGRGTCLLCNVELTSADQTAKHIAGRAHKKLLSKMIEKENPTQWARTPETWCDICQKPFTGIQSARQHYESAKHKKKKEETATRSKFCYEILKQDNPSQMTGIATCITSNKSADLNESASESNLNKNSQFGKSAYELQPEEEAGGLTAKSQTTSTYTEKTEAAKSSNCWCEICEVPLSGKENAMLHYAGKPHEKRMRKMQLSLTTDSFAQKQNKSKENSSGQDSLTEDSDRTTEIEASLSNKDSIANSELGYCQSSELCGICNKTFTGPESASEHYAGRKHRSKLELYRFDLHKYSDKGKLSITTDMIQDGASENHKKQTAEDNDIQETAITVVDDSKKPSLDVEDQELKSCINEFYNVLHSSTPTSSKSGTGTLLDTPQVQKVAIKEDPIVNSNIQTHCSSAELITRKVISSAKDTELAVGGEIAKTCPVCLVPFSSPFNARQHYEGKQHGKKMESLKIREPGSSFLNMPFTEYCDVIVEDSGKFVFPVELLNSDKVNIVPANTPLKEHNYVGNRPK